MCWNHFSCMFCFDVDVRKLLITCDSNYIPVGQCCAVPWKSVSLPLACSYQTVDVSGHLNCGPKCVTVYTLVVKGLEATPCFRLKYHNSITVSALSGEGIIESIYLHFLSWCSLYSAFVMTQIISKAKPLFLLLSCPI